MVEVCSAHLLEALVKVTFKWYFEWFIGYLDSLVFFFDLVVLLSVLLNLIEVN